MDMPDGMSKKGPVFISKMSVAGSYGHCVALS